MAPVRRAVEGLAGKIEEMRAEAEQREQRSQMIYEDVNQCMRSQIAFEGAVTHVTCLGPSMTP